MLNLKIHTGGILMSVVSQVSLGPINIDVVKNIVAETTKQITMSLVMALIAGKQEKLTSKDLAEKHIQPNLEDVLSHADAATQRIYKKLFLATHVHIQTHSPVLTLALAALQRDVNDETPGKFVGSFVWEATPRIIERLNTEQPDAVQREDIWQ